MDTRETALLLFVEMEKTKNFGSSLIRDTLNKYDYENPREKAFLKRLAEGTLESLLTLDYVINAYSKTPTNKMKPLIRSLLRLSVYQILYMDTVPDSAACNEAVRLAKKKGFERLSGFVNGVLRTITRNKEEILNSESGFWQELQKNPVQALSVRYSVPGVDDFSLGSAVWRRKDGTYAGETEKWASVDDPSGQPSDGRRKGTGNRSDRSSRRDGAEAPVVCRCVESGRL